MPKKKQQPFPQDRDALYDLFSLRGRLRFDHRKHVTHVYVEAHPEPLSISTPYADNNSERYDSAEAVRVRLRWWGRM